MSSAAPNRTFDVVVVGFGPGGGLGAVLTAPAGLRVVAFEKSPLGSVKSCEAKR